MVTVRGYYDGKVVKLLEPAPEAKPGEVRVTFDRTNEPAGKRRHVGGFGQWGDDRPAEEIIEEIYAARRSRTKEIDL